MKFLVSSGAVRAALSLTLLAMTLNAPNYVQSAACPHLKRIDRAAESLARSEQPSGHSDDTRSQEMSADAPVVDELEEQQLRLEFIKQQILLKLGIDRAPKVRRKQAEVEAYMHLMDDEMQQATKRTERNQATVSTSTPSSSGSANSPQYSEDSDKLFVIPALTTSTSATFNLTLNSATTSRHPVKKITLMLKQKIGVVGMASDLQIRLAASSWPAFLSAADQEPKILGYVEPESLPDSFENYLHEGEILEWIEYDLTPLLMDEDMYQLKGENTVVVSSEWLQFSRAYLRIEYEDTARLQRNKRSADCEAGGNSTSCCRETFYVNFSHVGWDSWILQPAGYFANYCKGKCDISQSRYHHTTVVQKYPSLISLCCSPGEMSHISLIYIDEAGYVLQKNLPNMVVESCDCA